MFFCGQLIFFKINILENFFQNHYQSVKQFRTDLGPNCLHRLSADVFATRVSKVL